MDTALREDDVNPEYENELRDARARLENIYSAYRKNLELFQERARKRKDLSPQFRLFGRIADVFFDTHFKEWFK